MTFFAVSLINSLDFDVFIYVTLVFGFNRSKSSLLTQEGILKIAIVMSKAVTFLCSASNSFQTVYRHSSGFLKDLEDSVACL